MEPLEANVCHEIWKTSPKKTSGKNEDLQGEVLAQVQEKKTFLPQEGERESKGRESGTETKGDEVRVLSAFSCPVCV